MKWPSRVWGWLRLRGAAIARRWLSIALVTVVGATIATGLIAVLREPYLNQAILRLVALPIWAQLVLDAQVVGVLVVALRRIRAFSGRQLFTIVYPSNWWAGVAGACLSLVAGRELGFGLTYWPAGHEITLSFYAVALAVTAAGLAWSAALGGVGRGLKVPKTQQYGGSIEADVPWWRFEEPVASPGHDKFGYSPIARRIASRLVQVPAPTIGLFGPFGAGKSSVLKMVEHYLAHPSELDSDKGQQRSAVLVAQVGAWGINDEPATERILQAIVDRVTLEANAGALRSLPAHYRAALGGAGQSWITVVGQLMAGEAIDVGTQFERLSDTLEALDCNLVVFVEDIDRSPNQAVGHQVAGLLDVLRGVRRISVVLATSRASGSPGVFERLCQFVEVLPALSTGAVGKEIVLATTALAEKYPDDIAVAGPGPDMAFGGIRTETQTVLPHTAIAYMATVLNSARLVKTVLRRSDEAWSVLHGEIRLDDVVVWTTLRAAMPSVSELLLELAPRLRALRVGQDRVLGNPDDAKHLYALVHNAIDNSGVDKSAAKGLIAYLLPTPWHDGETHDRRSLPLQGVDRASPTDYLARLYAEGIDEQELRDQTVLAQISEYARSGSDALPKAILENQKLPKKVMQFHGSVGPALFRLFGQYVQVLLAAKEEKSAFDANGLRELWNCTLWYREHRPAGWLLNMVKLALPKSVTLAGELYYFLSCESEDQVAHRESNAPRFAEVSDAFRCQFQPAPKTLVPALSIDRPDGLARLLSWMRLEDAATQPMLWLGPLLIDACREAQPQAVGAVAALLTSYGETAVSIVDVKANVDIIRASFETPALLAELLAEMLPGSAISPAMRARLDLQLPVIQNYLARWRGDSAELAPKIDMAVGHAPQSEVETIEPLLGAG